MYFASRADFGIRLRSQAGLLLVEHGDGLLGACDQVKRYCVKHVIKHTCNLSGYRSLQIRDDYVRHVIMQQLLLSSSGFQHPVVVHVPHGLQR